jgi:hypothetical protein
VADEGPPDGFETAPERRRKRLPALFALAALVVVGATLGVVASLGDGGGNPDVVAPQELAPPDPPRPATFSDLTSSSSHRVEARV